MISLVTSFFFSNKPLPPNPTPNYSVAKQPAFSPSLPEHVYQNCFGGAGGAGDWNSSLQCLSLKFENLWDAAVMKSWNPSVLSPESLPGEPSNPKRSQQVKDSQNCNLLFINRWHAWTTPWRAPPSDIIHRPPRGSPLAAHLSASFLFLVIVLVFVFIIVMLVFRTQRAEEEWRQEEVSVQFPGCLHGDQPSGDGHFRLHILRVLHCHHCPVK